MYKGRLHTGEWVAVKVQRPNIGESIAVDMLLLRRLMGVIDRNVPQVRGLRAEAGEHEGRYNEGREEEGGRGEGAGRGCLKGGAGDTKRMFCWLTVAEVGSCSERHILPPLDPLLQIMQPLVPLVDVFAGRLLA